MASNKVLKVFIANLKRASLYLVIGFYTLTGINHFIHPEFYIKIIPPWLSAQDYLVFVCRIFEVFFALLMIFSATSRVGSLGIILLLMQYFHPMFN
jgi:uncharacterized membrane protein